MNIRFDNNVMKHLKGHAVNLIPWFFLVLILFVLSGCDTATYENSSLSGCYALNNDISIQLWFDGVDEFEEIYWTDLSGTVSYAGKYYVSQNELRLEYYSYDPDVYTLYINPGFISLDGEPYYLVGDQCM